MLVWTNINQGSTLQFFTGNPCAGSHAFAQYKVSGRDDNCLTIDAYPAKKGAVSTTLLRIGVTQTRSGGRAYVMLLNLRPDEFGLADSSPSHWMPNEINDNPERKAFMARVQEYAQLLRNAASTAVGFDKPQNAFEAVPSFRSLMPPSAAVAN